jgi:nicotinate-nucleotide adenylyltransferase
MRIGLLGGTFNPIHLGHLGAAREALRCGGLERVWLVPAALPPHKPTLELAPAAERLAMIDLAIAGDRALARCTLELERPGPSYTIDTVRGVLARLPAEHRLHFIVGLDAFLEIDTWRAWRELLRLVDLIVVARPEGDGGVEGLQAAVGGFLRRRVDAGCRWEADTRRFRHGRRSVLLCPNPPPAVSASEIRRRVRGGAPYAHLLPPPVAAHIQRKGLYR